MGDNLINYQIVIFTNRHTITGDLILKDKRLSDHINERVDTMLGLRNVTVARLENPAQPLYSMPTAVVPKSSIVLIFEPPQNAIPPSNRFFGYTKKEKHEVFLIMDSMEIRGVLHTLFNPDFRLVLVNLPDAFQPITNAVIRLEANPTLVVRQDTILFNTQRVRFIAELAINSPTIPRPPVNTENP